MEEMNKSLSGRQVSHLIWWQTKCCLTAREINHTHLSEIYELRFKTSLMSDG